MSEQAQDVTPAFEAIVADGVDALPQWVKDKLDNVVFVAECAPSPEIMREEGLERDDELFGYYHGIPLTERGEFYGVGAVLPDTISIFQKAHEVAAGDDASRMAQLVRETVWHEVGHYIGLDEEEVRAREHERGHLAIDPEK